MPFPHFRHHSSPFFFFLMLRRPPRSTLFPSRRSSDLRRGRRTSGRAFSRGRRGGVRPGHPQPALLQDSQPGRTDRKSTRLNSSHVSISYAVFCLKKKKKQTQKETRHRHRGRKQKDRSR